jgi:hypothetical protein
VPALHLLQVQKNWIPCYITIRKARGDLNKTTGVAMNNSKGNQNQPRPRVSDLSSPPVRSRTTAPSTDRDKSQDRPVPAESRVDMPANSSTVPAPKLKTTGSPPPANGLPTHRASRVQNQRNLSDLLYQSPGTWSNREAIQDVIGKRVLNASKSMETRNFQRVGKLDLEHMAEAYDAMFLDGLCLPLARSYGLTFRLSSRMTRAGGKTTRTIYRGPSSKAGRTHYEIALSTSLLFQSFRKPGDSIRVCGYDCQDRLTAMQRIVEHEMIHLCEMLAWIHSDCSAGRFQSIARNMFGHTEHRHELITQQERAAKEFNVRAGAHVAFLHEGKTLHGIVNRITRRATILVEDPTGERYSNGRHYLKYYVPIQQLRPIT